MAIVRRMAAIVLLGLASNWAGAALVTIEFSGLATVTTDFSASLPSTGILTGSYTFDGSEPDANPSPGVGDFVNGIVSVTLNYAGLSWSRPSGATFGARRIQVLDDVGSAWDSYNLQTWSMTGSQLAGRDPTYLLLAFGGPGMLDGDQLAALNTNFSYANVQLDFGTTTGVTFVGLSISPVPEAKTFAMMSVALVLVGWTVRRMKRPSA